MEEKDYIGGNGVDTDFEREQLNYSPDIQHSSKKSSGGIDETPDTTLEQDTTTTHPVTNIYIQIGETYSYVTNLVSKIEQGLIGTYIPITETQANAILSSNVKVDGIESISVEKGIPFEVYRKAILYPDNPTYALIQDAVESYAEDIDGNIQLELYPDAKELQINLEELHYLLGNTVYNKFIDEETIPKMPVMDDDFYQSMKEQEKKQQETYETLQNLHKVNETIYYGLLTTAYEAQEYYEALAEYEETKRELEDFTRRVNQQTDLVSFADIDSSMTNQCARRINRYVSALSSVDEEEVSALLAKQYETDSTEYAFACAQMQTVTKLQVNKQIEQKQQSKDLLKTTGGITTKKRVHDEVINLTNLRDGVYLDLYGMMNNMVEPSRSDGVELFLNQVAEGMEVVRDNYKVYMQEMYQTHMIEQEVRYDKVNLTGDKQVARDSYWLLDNLLK